MMWGMRPVLMDIVRGNESGQRLKRHETPPTFDFIAEMGICLAASCAKK